MYLFNYTKEEPEVIVKKITEIALSNYPKIITRNIIRKNRTYRMTALQYVLDIKFVLGKEPKNENSPNWSPDGSVFFTFVTECDKFLIVYYFPKINPSFSEFVDLIIRNENFLLDRLEKSYLPWITKKISKEELEKRRQNESEKRRKQEELKKREAMNNKKSTPDKSKASIQLKLLTRGSGES